MTYCSWLTFEIVKGHKREDGPVGIQGQDHVWLLGLVLASSSDPLKKQNPNHIKFNGLCLGIKL